MTPTAGAGPLNSPTISVDDPALDVTYRKVAWRLLPFLMTLWILAWIDRVNIGFAKLQMLSELRFSETVYGLGAGIFFLGYFLFEVPSNLLLERIGAKRTIARITVLWGITCIAMMWVTTPLMFYVLRFLLGVFEAGFYPGVILYLTYWFPTGRRAKAFGLFMSASAFAGVIGGPMAGNLMIGLQGVNGWSGWQWVFLIEGIPSVIAGIVTLLYLTDRPEEAGKWLDQNERQMLIADLARDRGALSGREHNMFAALRSARMWQFVAIFFCIIMANSALTFFGPTIVREVGFESPAAVGWIMSAIYLCGAAGMILNGSHSDRSREARYHCGIAALVAALGLIVLGILLPGTPLPSLLALGVAVVGTMSAIPVFWQMPNRYLAGTAAAAGVAFINSIANLAGFAAPFLMGAVKDGTGSLSYGLWIVAGFEALTVLLILLCIPREESSARI